MSSDAELHARRAHPDFEYRTTTGPRKQWDGQNTPPADTDGNPDPTWERNVDAGRDGWERFDYTEESYWRRRKKTAQPCTGPECGGEVHTDPWGTPVQCPHRRCPRCDCPDGHTQCDHCKICVHADGRQIEPTHLTGDQLAPIVAALCRRETAALLGLRLLPLPPFPDCPSCGRPPTELAVGNSNQFIDDRIRFGFRPCGHTFTVDGEDLYAAYDQARQETSP